MSAEIWASLAFYWTLVWGILCDQFLGPVVLSKRVTGTAYHRFLVNDLRVLLEHEPLHQR
jgi:hypothetical protein